MKQKWTTIIVVALAAGGCYYDKEEILYPVQQKCDTAGVTYAGTVAPIIAQNCLSCHSSAAYSQSGGGYNLEGYNNIHPYSNPGGLLVKSITGDPSVSLMPPTGKLPNCDIVKIQTWVNAGAPNN